MDIEAARQLIADQIPAWKSSKAGIMVLGISPLQQAKLTAFRVRQAVAKAEPGPKPRLPLVPVDSVRFQTGSRHFGPALPKQKDMSRKLRAWHRKPIQDASRARALARAGVAVDPDVRKKERRKGTNAKRDAKACKYLPGIEFLAMDPCAYCGCANPTTHDHIEPVSRGGAHDVENLTKACWRCNREKNTQPLALFLARRALRKHRAA